MKKLYSLLVMMLVGFAATWAATTGTIAFGSAAGNTKIDATTVTGDDSAGNTWTITTVMSETSFTQNSGYSQVGAAKKPATSITFTTSLPESVQVTAFSAKFGGFSGTEGNVSLKVGDTEVGTGTLNATNDVTVEATQAETGNVLTITVTNIAKGVKVYNISYTYTAGDTPAETYAITYNEMENGSVTGPAEAAEGTTVTLTVEPDNGYQLASLTVEDENDVAISVSNNKFTMPAGPVYVSATFEEIPPLTSLATVNAYADGTEFTFTAPTVVLGKKNRNMYIANADNSAGTLLYASANWDADFTFGKEIAGGWSGSKTTYKTKPEVQNLADVTLSGNEVTLTPIEISAADLTLANFGRYAVLRSAVSDGSVITDANNVAVTTYDQFDYAVPTAGTYDIYGVIGWNDNAGQFMILSSEALDVPEPTKYAIEIDAQIVNGTVKADKAEAAEGETVTLTVTPATGYELEAITVLDGDANEVEVSANHTFEMPASNVTVSATFAEQGEQPAVTSVVFEYGTGKEFAQENGTVMEANTKSGVTITWAKGTSNNDPKWYSSTNGNARVYNGNTITIDAGNANIKTVTFTYDGSYALSTPTVTPGSWSNDVWTVNASSGTLTVGNTARISTITVELGEAEPVTKYAIEIDDQIVNGSIEADKAEAAEGETVTLTVTPATGYELEAITVLDGEANEVEVSANYTFEMPASDVIVSATFVEQGEQPAVTSVVFEYGTGKEFAQENGTVMEANTKSGVTITWAKGTSNNDPKWYSSTNGNARVYNGNTITIDAGNATIKTVTFTYDGSYALGTPTVTPGSWSNDVWTVNASSGTLTSSATARISTITVELGEAAPVTKYAIEIDDQIVNGSIEADKAEAAEGETVTLTVTPNNGYKLDAITVLDGEANEVEVIDNAFTMPASDVIVSATFVELQTLTTNATIVFKGSNAESGIASLEELESYVEEGYALIADAEFDAVYSAKVEEGEAKDGIRINKGSYQGSLKLTLANAYAANKLVVKAMPYGTDAAKMLVNGTQFNMESGAGFADYEVTLDGSALNEITIAAAQKSTCRFYVKSISIICEEPVATTDMAEVTEAGEYVVTEGTVVAFDDDAQTVYTTDGQENWLPILIEDADLYAQAKAAATLSQIAGSFDASKTAPLFTATAFKAEGEFVENSQEIYTFDLSDDKAVIDPKAGQVIKIKGIWYGGVLRAYSGANGGNRGRSFTVLGATDALVEGTAYSIPVAVTLKAAWDEEAPAGAPKRVAKDGDAAFQNLQGKIVGGADMIEGVSTAVTDLNSDKAISGVQYVNVAGQVSAEPFEGVNIVVTTYVDGSRSAVKVVR